VIQPAAAVVAALWADAGLDPAALERLDLTGREPVLASSFAVGTAAQATIAAAALAATEVGRRRNGVVQRVGVDLAAAAAECRGWFSIDGRTPEIWDRLSGLYHCGSGWVRVHANFAHHRNGVLRLLGLPPGPDTPRSAVEAALRERDPFEFERAAADAGMVVAALRSFAQWDSHPQGEAVAALPLVAWEKIAEAPPRTLPPLDAAARPLAGLRVLDLTRILAGPVAGRTLAAYGADVMLVNSPALPNIEAIVETSRGKLSCHVDLREAAGRDALRGLIAGADVMIQGYRPGGLEALGFGPAEVARIRPGIVTLSLSAYGHAGPWAPRRGFDSLVQTATGFNDAERIAAGSDAPRALPFQVLDYASGFLLAFAALAALLRQTVEGGSWHLRVGLAVTAQWLRSLGRVDGAMGLPRPALDPYLQRSDSGWGELIAVGHAARFERTPARWDRPSMPPGAHPPRWPDRAP
jgi:hypothetical protein